jgi:hypothetical protein
MKKTIALTLFTSLIAVTQVMATNYDLYVSGSTAFRKNAYAAFNKLFDNPSSSLALGNNGTGSTNAAAQDTRWTMSGTAATLLGTTNTDTLTIHALWTGSVQGLSALVNKDQLVFLKNATAGDATTSTNTSTIAFSDVFAAPTLDPLPSGSFSENEVAVQPFVFVKSAASKGVSSVTNITWQQLVTLLGSSTGSTPLANLTGNPNDVATNVYLVHRSLDSGTRVTTVQEGKYTGTVTINYYDSNSDSYFLATTNRGPAAFGAGYVGGPDVVTALGYSTPGNQGIGYLSWSDAKGITGTSWDRVLSYNGVYPTLNFTPGTVPSTNDFTPIITGKYSFWAFEMLDAPKSGQYGTYTDQNLGFTQLTAIINKLKGSGSGSIDQEILNTTGNARTAIRLGDMQVGRATVGGVISY